MKTLRLLFAVLAVGGALVACKPDGPQPEPKSSECRLTLFNALAEDYAVVGFVDQADKSVELPYMESQLEGLKNATAMVRISENATISPDPAVERDYTVEGGVNFTVTAEDGVSKTVYNIYTAPAVMKQAVVKKWAKKLPVSGKANNDCGVAFVDYDKVAFADLSIVDLDGNIIDTLNVEGVTGLLTYGDGTIKSDKQLASMSNDKNGVLVAVTAYEGTYEDGSVGCRTEVYAWVDGYSNPPTKIYGPVDYQCMYMSVAGDVKGEFILNFRTGVSQPPQMHHVLVYKGGGYFKADGSPNCTWYGPKINHPSNDGCWGQQLSFFSGNPEDGFVCWDSLAAAEYGDTGNASSAYYYYNSLSGFMSGSVDEVALKGCVTWGKWDSEGQRFQYGNHSYGHVRAFKYIGEKYIVASSNSWLCGWVTIQRGDSYVEDDEETDEVDESAVNYLLPTDRIEGGQHNPPCSAYVYDPVTGTGHVIFETMGGIVVSYDLTTTIL